MIKLIRFTAFAVVALAVAWVTSGRPIPEPIEQFLGNVFLTYEETDNMSEFEAVGESDEYVQDTTDSDVIPDEELPPE